MNTPGVIVLVLHAVDNFNLAITEGVVGPIQETHSPLGLQQSVLHNKATRSYVLPSTQIMAVEKRLPAKLLGRRQGCGTRQDQQRQYRSSPHRFPSPLSSSSTEFSV